MSTKSVACTVFLIICFSSYTLSNPLSEREQKSSVYEEPHREQKSLQKRSTDEEPFPIIDDDRKPCGLICELKKAKTNILNGAKSAVDDAKRTIENTGQKVKETVNKVVNKIKNCHQKLKDDVSKFIDTTEILPYDEFKKDVDKVFGAVGADDFGNGYDTGKPYGTVLEDDGIDVRIGA